jgi:S1-C subfamily serine protease
VLRGSAAEAAGLAAGDELIAVDGWRLRRLDDLTRLMASKGPAQLLVARDQRMLTLTLELPAAPESGAVSLALAPADKTPPAAFALRRAWLPG